MSEEKKETPPAQSVTKDTVKIRITDGNGWLYGDRHYLQGDVIEISKAVYESMSAGGVKTTVIK